jgi:NADH-quinone oxidoreductase subunit A
MIETYIPIILMLLVALAFGLVMSRASEWLGPRNPNPEKLSTYESGMEPVGTARERFSVKFYLVAMLFIIFDIEVVFLYSWAVVFKQLGIPAFVEMFIFIAVLFLGYFYVVKKGALQWD